MTNYKKNTKIIYNIFRSSSQASKFYLQNKATFNATGNNPNTKLLKIVLPKLKLRWAAKKCTTLCEEWRWPLYIHRTSLYNCANGNGQTGSINTTIPWIVRSQCTPCATTKMLHLIPPSSNFANRLLYCDLQHHRSCKRGDHTDAFNRALTLTKLPSPLRSPGISISEAFFHITGICTSKWNTPNTPTTHAHLYRWASASTETIHCSFHDENSADCWWWNGRWKPRNNLHPGLKRTRTRETLRFAAREGEAGALPERKGASWHWHSQEWRLRFQAGWGTSGHRNPWTSTSTPVAGGCCTCCFRSTKEQTTATIRPIRGWARRPSCPTPALCSYMRLEHTHRPGSHPDRHTWRHHERLWSHSRRRSRGNCRQRTESRWSPAQGSTTEAEGSCMTAERRPPRPLGTRRRDPDIWWRRFASTASPWWAGSPQESSQESTATARGDGAARTLADLEDPAAHTPREGRNPAEHCTPEAAPSSWLPNALSLSVCVSLYTQNPLQGRNSTTPQQDQGGKQDAIDL